MAKVITTDSLLWLNGTWAGLIVENGGNVMQYASTISFPLLDRYLTKKILKQWWGVTNRKTLLEQIDDKSEYCMLRQGYDKAVAQREVWSLGDEDFYKTIKELDLSDSEYDNLLAVHEIGKQREPINMIAYDYGRVIMLCEYGYLSGYLTLDESIDMAIAVGKKLQVCFSSWEESNESYLVGYLFWLIVAEQNVVANWQSRVKALESVQAMEKGPFHLDWNLELTR